jgi:hypothetical protein
MLQMARIFRHLERIVKQVRKFVYWEHIKIVICYAQGLHRLVADLLKLWTFIIMFYNVQVLT